MEGKIASLSLEVEFALEDLDGINIEEEINDIIERLSEYGNVKKAKLHVPERTLDLR